jgi:hypothetical protein
MTPEQLLDYAFRRVARIFSGERLQYNDVMLILGFLGTCIIAGRRFLRVFGDKQIQAEIDAADERMRETAKLAEREGWHSVLYWHRRFGYASDTAITDTPRPRKERPFLRVLLWATLAIAVIAIIVWERR